MLHASHSNWHMLANIISSKNYAVTYFYRSLCSWMGWDWRSSSQLGWPTSDNSPFCAPSPSVFIWGRERVATFMVCTWAIRFGTITYVKHPWMGSLLLVNDSLVLPCWRGLKCCFQQPNFNRALKSNLGYWSLNDYQVKWKTKSWCFLSWCRAAKSDLHGVSSLADDL